VPSANLPSARENPSELKEMSDFLPARVLDGEGREGDMLNLNLIAQKEDLEQAFDQAGCVRVDKSKPAVIFWHMLCQRTHYTKLPMARFYVFGRAYLASADPVFEAQTTRGQTYYSDSRMLLLELDQVKRGSPGLLGNNFSSASGSAAGIMARY
jgi:LssY C-terminus